MIKATELRIGNYIKHDPHNPVIEIAQLFSDSFQKKGGGSYTYEYSDGIPLTEEWLTKFGFFEHKSGDEVIHYKSTLYAAPTIEFVRTVDGIIVTNFCTINDYSQSPNLKYVHQLQNLYFALTGEELTIKETL